MSYGGGYGYTPQTQSPLVDALGSHSSGMQQSWGNMAPRQPAGPPAPQQQYGGQYQQQGGWSTPQYGGQAPPQQQPYQGQAQIQGGYSPTPQSGGWMGGSFGAPPAPWQGFQSAPSQYGGARWQPQQYQQPAWGGQMPQLPQPQVQGGGPSLEGMALGNSDDPQQTQNFLHALQMVGAGQNNAAMRSAAPRPQQQTQFLGGPAAYNGSSGSAQYAGGFGYGGGGVNYYGMSPQTGMYNTNSGVMYGGMSPAYGAPPPPPAAPQQQPYSPPSGPSSPQPGTTAVRAMPRVNNDGTAVMSDENVKDEIRPAKEDVADFLAKIGAHSYEYKNPEHGVGRFVSPMAQELEKTTLGKSAVVETPDGKAVHYGRLMGIAIAAEAMLNDRVNKLERKLSRR